jgi:hypothetical protein
LDGEREPEGEEVLAVTVQLRGNLAKGIRTLMQREGNPATTIVRRFISQGIRAELEGRNGNG